MQAIHRTSSLVALGCLTVMPLATEIELVNQHAEDSKTSKDAQDSAAPLSPSEVQELLERELQHDGIVDSSHIDAEVSEGVATLSGSVPSLGDKERAARIAGTVKGIAAVVNRLRVDPNDHREDQEILRDVREAVLVDPVADSYELDLDVQGSVVVLRGSVDSWAERDLCERVVSRIRGVTGVSNELSVTHIDPRSPEELRKEVAGRLRWDVYVDDGLIKTEIEDKSIRLVGLVGSTAEKQRAVHLAHVRGVESVDAEELGVARWARDEDLRARKYVPVADELVESAIGRALEHDPRVSRSSVTVEVRGGLATLGGLVENLRAKRAATSCARHTVGVLYVRDQLRVRPEEEVEDDVLEQRIRAALRRDPDVDRYEIRTHADAGRIFLYGTVDSYFEKSRADEVASGVRGVVEVKNRLDVEDPIYIESPFVDTWALHERSWYDRHELLHTPKSDARIRRDIQEEFFHSPYVDQDSIHVEVDDGIVTLRGQLESWLDLGAAVKNAYDGGAVHVRNEIDFVEPGALESSSPRRGTPRSPGE